MLLKSICCKIQDITPEFPDSISVTSRHIMFCCVWKLKDDITNTVCDNMFENSVFEVCLCVYLEYSNLFSFFVSLYICICQRILSSFYVVVIRCTLLAPHTCAFHDRTQLDTRKTFMQLSHNIKNV